MNTPTPTPRTDAATYPADCLGKTLVTNRDCPCALERELTALTAERDQLRFENSNLRACQKACEACDEPTAFGVQQLLARAKRAEAELAAERARLDWLESPAGMDWQWQAGITRATIDAKMKKDAK